MARCKNQNCKKKLDKNSTFVVKWYSSDDIDTGEFGKIQAPVKIKICRECAEMYFGEEYNKDSGFMTFTQDMEFSNEFQEDIFTKVSNRNG